MSDYKRERMETSYYSIEHGAYDPYNEREKDELKINVVGSMAGGR